MTFFHFKTFIYTNMKTNKKTKTKISITIDRNINKAIESFENKSRYIEWLIYQDLLSQNSIVEKIKTIVI
mgnify:CR=1 FL=1